MAHIAFVTWDGGGNVGPAIGIAQALRERGHSSHFLGYEGQRERLTAQGFAFSRLDKSGSFDVHASKTAETRLPALLRNVWACPEHLTDLPVALGRQPADLVVVDFLMQGALAWAGSAHVPVAVLAHSAVGGLVPPPESPVGATRLGAVNDLRRAVGLAPLRRLNDAWDDLFTLVTTIAELDPAASGAGPRVRYVGPIVERFAATTWQPPWPADDARPLILVSFSTTGFWDHSTRIRNTLAALANEPLRVLVLGAQADALGALPANTVLEGFLPHQLVMPKAAITITHCGHGTVTAALAHGVPLIGMPNKAADQPFLAARVQELGAGIALSEEEPAQIRAAVRRILAQPSYAAAARKLGAAIVASPGARGAAQELEAALGATTYASAAP